MKPKSVCHEEDSKIWSPNRKKHKMLEPEHEYAIHSSEDFTKEISLFRRIFRAEEYCQTGGSKFSEWIKFKNNQTI